MRGDAEVTENEAKYLKHIYRRQHEQSQDIRTTGLATSLGVRPATVTEVLQNLDEKGLLHYTPYHGVRLTEQGRLAAQTFLRKHRILETLLTRTLAYGPEEACRESLGLDYHASTRLIDAICRSLDHPERCPCGKAIFRGGHCQEHTGGDIDD
ncbi:MAG: metal-dependent transcriptional regulator [Candidatus Thermoplasmatota archaeon]|nr:metal-dependent transcriptional regulator [Candidatus Thermoplasmatota archaeon]